MRRRNQNAVPAIAHEEVTVDDDMRLAEITMIVWAGGADSCLAAQRSAS